MDILWSPWRSKYIESFKDPKCCSQDNECFICKAYENPEQDKELLVVSRFEHCFVMLNKFPYNNGHVLISPNRHIGDINDLNEDEMLDMLKVLRLTTKMLDKVCKPHGYNVGMNLGRVSGAGLPEHVHIHVVPRWNGDTSFMAVISDVKIVSQALEESQEQFQKAFKEMLAEM